MRRRILFLEGNIDGTVGGSYYVMLDLVNALDKNRYDPVVGFHTDNFLIHKLKEAGIETHIFDNQTPFSFGSKKLDSLLLVIKKTLNFFKKFLLPALRYASFIRKNNIDLVNVNNSVVRNHPWMLAAKLAKRPCITHEMGINKRFSAISRYFGKRLKAIICVSRIVKDNMVKMGLDYAHTTVIHNGLDTTRYSIKETPDDLRRKYGISKKDPIIGVVGNIKWWKGQETLVRATKELISKYPDIKCLMVGAVPTHFDDYKKSLDDFCDKNNINQNVIFTGFQENPIDYMNLMDIVVHTSVEPEPFGIVLLEAMLLSKPLISTTIGGPAEIIINNETGLLVKPGDHNLLADAIDKLLSDREFAEKLGRGGYQRLITEFSIEKNAQKTMEIYDRVFSADLGLSVQRSPENF